LQLKADGSDKHSFPTPTSWVPSRVMPQSKAKIYKHYLLGLYQALRDDARRGPTPQGVGK